MSYTNVVFNQHITRSVNRDEIEHQRINDRVGFQTRFQTAGTLIFKPQQQSSLRVTQNQRFNKDHDVNDKIRRQSERDKLDRFYNARLDKRMDREEQKWQQQEKKWLKQEEKRLHHQKVLVDNKRNINGQAYNPITHAYEPSRRGEILAQKDQSKEVSRFARSKNIVEKNNAGFNIITGEEKNIVQQQIPERLRERVDRKYAQKKDREAVKYVAKRDKYDYLDDEDK